MRLAARLTPATLGVAVDCGHHSRRRRCRRRKKRQAVGTTKQVEDPGHGSPSADPVATWRDVAWASIPRWEGRPRSRCLLQRCHLPERTRPWRSPLLHSNCLARPLWGHADRTACRGGLSGLSCCSSTPADTERTSHRTRLRSRRQTQRRPRSSTRRWLTPQRRILWERRKRM